MTTTEVEIDPRALKAADLTNDWMANGYSDALFGFSFDPPAHQRDRVSYMRGYERAGQQKATSVEEEYEARTGLKLCSACTNSYSPHRWGKQAAQNAGWFFSKDGTAHCPEHVPEWVEGWRAGRG